MHEIENIKAYIADLTAKRAALWETEGKPLVDIANERAYTVDEQARMAEVEAAFARFDRGLEQARGQLEAAEQRAKMGLGGSSATPAGAFIRTNDRLPATVERGKAFNSHPIAERYAGQVADRDASTVAQFGDLVGMLRALSTTGASAIVPTTWAGSVIDLARNKSALIQAGAQIVPMESKVVQIGRVTGDATAAFRTEGSSIDTSDPTFDNVTLTAKSLNALVVANAEWLQDADNGAELVTTALAEAIAAKIDLVGLYGGIESGAGSINLPTPPNPRGILAALNAVASGNVLGNATNGTTQTAGHIWDEILDVVFTPADNNETPTGLIWNSKAARLYAKAVDTTGQPLAVPPALADIPRYVSNQIPSFTQGTMANVATDVFAGDFSKVLIGQRLGLTIQVLNERYADTGQIGIVASWRGDVGLARPKALAAYKAIKGAA